LEDAVHDETCQRDQTRQPHEQLVSKQDRHGADGALHNPVNLARASSNWQRLGQDSHCPEDSCHEEDGCDLQNMILRTTTFLLEKGVLTSFCRRVCTDPREKGRDEGADAVADGDACKKNPKRPSAVLWWYDISHCGAHDTSRPAAEQL
jgi:hypothetical protein